MPTKFPVLFAVLLIASLISPATGLVQAQDTAAIPAVVVLKVEGTIEFARPGWTSRQPLATGTLVTPTDLIFPRRRAY